MKIEEVETIYPQRSDYAKDRIYYGPGKDKIVYIVQASTREIIGSESADS